MLKKNKRTSLTRSSLMSCVFIKNNKLNNISTPLQPVMYRHYSPPGRTEPNQKIRRSFFNVNTPNFKISRCVHITKKPLKKLPPQKTTHFTSALRLSVTSERTGVETTSRTTSKPGDGGRFFSLLTSGAVEPILYTFFSLSPCHR